MAPSDLLPATCDLEPAIQVEAQSVLPLARRDQEIIHLLNSKIIFGICAPHSQLH